MQIQFEDGNNTRAGTVIFTTILCSYVHCAPSRYHLNKHEACDSLSEITSTGIMAGRIQGNMVLWSQYTYIYVHVFIIHPLQYPWNLICYMFGQYLKHRLFGHNAVPP